jgi:hypothetical protein
MKKKLNFKLKLKLINLNTTLVMIQTPQKIFKMKNSTDLLMLG